MSFVIMSIPEGRDCVLLHIASAIPCCLHEKVNLLNRIAAIAPKVSVLVINNILSFLALLFTTSQSMEMILLGWIFFQA